MLTWTCEGCGQPVADGAGYLTVDEEAAQHFPEQLAAWEAETIANNPAPDSGFTFITLPAVLAHPEPVHWEMLHANCDTNRGRGDYRVGVERIRTAAEILRWTAHLWEKSWLMHTDWDVVVQRAANQLDG